MDNLNDLKLLWQTAKTDRLPGAGEMLRLVKRFRSQKLRNKWLVIAFSLILAAIMLFAIILGHFQMLSTYIGGSLMMSACLLLSASNIRSLKRFYQLADSSNAEFLAFIEKTRQNQQRYYQKTMRVIMVLLSAGWLSYLYEPVSKQGGWLIALYAALIAYLAFLWFYIRPRNYQKNAAKLDALEERLEKINQQLK
ncbi:hypothetical protein [Mucilaginibacter corticis]|uniref:hypothetical protein n=1 Tax=Mucilaginibacter corticis TaxID=2597670 RepID=UPI0016432E4A|nr:hypothetical protein [Mucilaginibacter corticis]